MNLKNDKKQVKLTISFELYEWYEKRSKETGLSVPALMTFACDLYKNDFELIKRAE